MASETCEEVKKILSRKSPMHPQPKEIENSWKLKGTKLQFDDAGRRALAKFITDEIFEQAREENYNEGDG